MPTTGRTIKTKYWAKPVPDHRYDWEATLPDMNEDSPVGFGYSELEAISNLLRIVAEKEPCYYADCKLEHGHRCSCVIE